jgi:PKD repeat protein
MLRRTMLILSAIAATTTFFFCSCSHGRDMGSSPYSDIAAVAGQSSIQLENALTSINELTAPDGVDDDLFDRLKSELSGQLSARGAAKAVSAPPEGDLNRVNDLQITSNGDTTYTLSWHYKNLGDYDQNGTVGISDITPLAIHFSEAVPLGNTVCIQSVIDGSGNGEIDISDITPIAMNFRRECAGYRIEGAPADGDFAPVALVDFEQATGSDTERASFEHTLALGDNRRFRVVPVDSASAEGLPSNEAATYPTAPGITSVSPASGTEGSIVTFSAVVSGTPPLTYAWDFGGAAAPNTSSLADPQVTLGSPELYDCSLTVTNAYGEASFPFQFEVTEDTQEPLELWYFQMVNLLPDDNVTSALQLMQQAKDAGYTKAVIADFKFGTIDIQSDHYRDNVAAFAQGAEATGVEIIPALVPIGYSDAFLCHDPNLIEPQPVVDCVFEVSGDTADVVQDAVLGNGGFEDYTDPTHFDVWNEMDPCHVDTGVFHSGAASVRFDPSGGTNFRITQALTVTPWNCYAISLWVKTSSVSPVGSLWFRIFSADPFKQLTFLTYNIAPTQDWTQYHLIFNSQDNSEVLLYLGLWGGTGGQFWFDDVAIENTGLINLIRRDGAPFTVTSQDGSVEYVEGVDYDYVSDPLMGEAGSYTGTFDLYHERPVITITPGSAIDDSDRLLVSYYHCAFVYRLQTSVCLTEEGTYDITHDTLLLVNDIINPSQVFISVDEMRVANWCDSCQSTGKTPGELLTDCTTRIDEIALAISPAWTLTTWSDMYDPYHNAHDDYYLVNGTLEGSWNGLPASWDIGNWRHFGDRTETIAFFADRGHRQILAGYYDEPGPDFTIDDWLDDAQGYEGVYAVMYTTWINDYGQLAAWAQHVRDWEAANE